MANSEKGSQPSEKPTISLLDFLLKLSNESGRREKWRDASERETMCSELTPQQREAVLGGDADRIRELIEEEERSSGRVSDQHGQHKVVVAHDDPDGPVFAHPGGWTIVALILHKPPAE